MKAAITTSINIFIAMAIFSNLFYTLFRTTILFVSNITTNTLGGENNEKTNFNGCNYG